MINLYNMYTFEVGIFTRYEDKKGDTKCRNGVVTGNWNIRQSAYKFLLAFYSNYTLRCTVSEIERYWSKIADFNLPHLHMAIPLGVIPIDFHPGRWYQKTVSL